jgi:hypothetical protein
MTWFDRSLGGKKEPEKTDKKPDMHKLPDQLRPRYRQLSQRRSCGNRPRWLPLQRSRVTGQLTFQGSAKSMEALREINVTVR